MYGRPALLELSVFSFLLWRRSTFFGILVLGCFFLLMTANDWSPSLSRLRSSAFLYLIQKEKCVCFFLGNSTLLGIPWNIFRFAYGPPLVVGCPLGPSAVLQGFLCCRCLSDTVFDRFLSFPGLVLPRNLSPVRLSFPAFPFIWKRKTKYLCVFCDFPGLICLFKRKYHAQTSSPTHWRLAHSL